MSALYKPVTALFAAVAMLLAGLAFAVSPASASAPSRVPAAVAPVAVAPHAANGYGGAPVTITVTITQNANGTFTITLTIAGFKPGETIIIYIRSTPVQIGSGVAGSDGVLHATVTTPAGFTGSHTIEAVGQSSGIVASSAVQLGSGSGSGSGGGSSSGSGSNGGGLSSTGVAVVGIGALGVVLLLGGGLLLIAGRRRRTGEV